MINPVRKCSDGVLSPALTKTVYLPTPRQAGEYFSTGMKKGMTLIELIVIIVVFAIAMPPLMLMLSDTIQKSVWREKYYQGIVFGRDKIEYILSNNFADISICTNPATCPYTDALNGYQRNVTVHYVEPNQSEPPSNCTNGTQKYALDCYKSSSTNYKRIDIDVQEKLTGDLNFSCVVSSGHQPEP